MKLTFNKVKETKNTIRFDNKVEKEGERPAIDGSLYVLKTAPEAQKDTLTVTIE